MVGTAAKVVSAVGISLAIFFGLLAYSYSQIQYSLQGTNVASIDWSHLSPATAAKAAIDFETSDYGALVSELVQGIKIAMTVSVTNRGFLPVTIPDLTYGLHVNNVDVGPGVCQSNITVNPGETKLIQCTQNITKSGIDSAAASLLESKGLMNIQVDGTAYPQAFGISLPIPVHGSKQVALTDEIKKRVESVLSGSQKPG